MTDRDDLRLALDAIEAADAAHDLDELPRLLLPVMIKLFGAETAAWTAFRGGPHGRARPHYGYPVPLMDVQDTEIFEHHLPGFPLGCHTRPGGAGDPVRRSDLQSLHDLRNSGMYADIVRRLGTEQMLATALVRGTGRGRPGGGDLHVCLSLLRSGRDFGPDAVELLTRLRPLLARRVHQLDPEPAKIAPAALTARQSQVLGLVGQGLTDAAIARRLGCSPRTVDKHLEHVYGRLGVRGRAAATASWIRAQHRLIPADSEAPQGTAMSTTATELAAEHVP